jgi:hypothetical protein
MYSSISAAANPWTASWLFRGMTTAGWIDYSDPRPEFPFQRKLRTWFVELPDGAPGQFVEFTATGNTSSPGDRTPRTIRLVNLGRTVGNQKTLQTIRFEFNADRRDSSTLAVSLNVKQFYQGSPLRTCVDSFTSSIDIHIEEVICILRGVPVARPYNPGVTRYVRTRLRRNAFKCQRAATQVAQARLSDQRQILYRSDVWLTPDIPFGTLQFDLTETEAATGTQYSWTRFVVTDFSPTDN